MKIGVLRVAEYDNTIKRFFSLIKHEFFANEIIVLNSEKNSYGCAINFLITSFLQKWNRANILGRKPFHFAPAYETAQQHNYADMKQPSRWL